MMLTCWGKAQQLQVTRFNSASHTKGSPRSHLSTSLIQSHSSSSSKQLCTDILSNQISEWEGLFSNLVKHHNSPYGNVCLCVSGMRMKHPGRGTTTENQASPPEPSIASFESFQGWFEEIPCISQLGCTWAMLLSYAYCMLILLKSITTYYNHPGLMFLPSVTSSQFQEFSQFVSSLIQNRGTRFMRLETGVSNSRSSSSGTSARWATVDTSRDDLRLHCYVARIQLPNLSRSIQSKPLLFRYYINLYIYILHAYNSYQVMCSQIFTAIICYKYTNGFFL